MSVSILPDLSEPFPWAHSLNGYQCVYCLAYLEKISQEKTLSEKELIYYVYLSFRRKSKIPAVHVTDCLRLARLKRPAFLFLVSLFYIHGFDVIKRNLYKAKEILAYLVKQRFADAELLYYRLSLALTKKRSALLELYAQIENSQDSLAKTRNLSYVDILLKSHQDCEPSLLALIAMENQDDILSSYYLGLHYLYVENYKEAFFHLAIGAEKGHENSKLLCGYLALNGKGIEGDDLLALSYFLSAEENPYCNYQAGRILYQHKELSQNQVLSSFKKAYEQGYVKAGIPLAIHSLSTLGEFEKGKRIIQALLPKFKRAALTLKSLLRNPTNALKIQALCQ